MKKINLAISFVFSLIFSFSAIANTLENPTDTNSVTQPPLSKGEYRQVLLEGKQQSNYFLTFTTINDEQVSVNSNECPFCFAVLEFCLSTAFTRDEVDFCYEDYGHCRELAC